MASLLQEGSTSPAPFSFGRADGAENIGRTRPLVVRRRRPCPAFRPSAGDLVFLPYPSFAFKPNLYRLARSLFCGCLLHEGEKVFLKPPAAPPSSACWRGRAESLRKPICRSSRLSVGLEIETRNSSKSHCAR